MVSVSIMNDIQVVPLWPLITFKLPLIVFDMELVLGVYCSGCVGDVLHFDVLNGRFSFKMMDFAIRIYAMC